MNDSTEQIDMDNLEELTKLRVVFSVLGMDQVQIRRDVTYKGQGRDALSMDVYSPSDPAGPMPAVIFVIGYDDSTAEAMAVRRLKEWGSYESWGELVAASGFVGITYSTTAPPDDARAVLDFVRDHATDLNIDPARIGIWAASGNGPTALSLLADDEARLKFAVMFNTYMLDTDGDTTIADMAAEIGFAAPNAGATVGDLDASTAMFIVRSGRDEVPGLNWTIDRFVSAAIESNRAINFVNLPDAPHGFDTLYDTDESREVVSRALAFMASSVRS